MIDSQGSGSDARAMTRMALLLSILAFSLGARAFDILPEYQGLNEAELERMERPSDLDAEYQSVIDSYLPRFAWEKAWDRPGRSFETSVGSITNQHFLVYSRLKLDVDLEENLRFRLGYFEQRDREIDQVRHFVELQYRLSPLLAVAAYGEPSHYKRSNDIGAALLVTPSEYWSNRFYYTQHDFTRSGHNDLGDKFLGEDPMSIGWTGTFDDRTTYSRFGFRVDRPVTWNLPQEAKLFRYEKHVMFADWSLEIDDSKSVGARLQFDSTFKALSPVGVSTVVDESWKRDRLMTTLFHTIGRESDRVRWEPSLGHVSRAWTNGLGQKVMHQNVLPRVMARFDRVQVDVEMTDFKTYGDFGLTPPNQTHETIQGRSQIAYEFTFSNGASLMLAGNFDLDEWITLPTFEGGNAQFRTEF